MDRTRWIKFYRSLGWTVLPTTPGEKRVLYKWKKYQTCKPSDVEWNNWLRERKDWNLALVCGSASGVVGFDLDGPKSTENFFSIMGDFPPTCSYRTSRGTRWLFSCEGFVKSKIWGSVEDRVELLGDGRLAILPPSIHPNGGLYKWCAKSSVSDVGLGKLNLATSPTKPQDRVCGVEDWAVIPEGWRNLKLFQYAVSLRKRGCPKLDVRDFILSMNERRCETPLNDVEVYSILASADKYAN